MENHSADRMLYRINCLPLAELDLFDLLSFAFIAGDSLDTAFPFADRLLKILAVFDNSNNTSLLYLAVKATQDVLDWLFGIFACN